MIKPASRIVAAACGLLAVAGAWMLWGNREATLSSADAPEAGVPIESANETPQTNPAKPMPVTVPQAPAKPVETIAENKDLSGFFRAHCFQCHGPDQQEADLRLDVLTVDFTDQRIAQTWVDVQDRLNLGEMPPDSEPAPPAESLATVTDWIGERLRALRHESLSTQGRVLLRRLSRTEYANTVRDLLGVEFVEGERPEDLLPPDGSIGGFNKMSRGLLIDPSLIETYLTVAEQVADRAIAVRPPLVPTRTVRFEFEDTRRAMGIGYLVFGRGFQEVEDGVLLYQGGARTGYELKHPFNGKQIPITGNYRVRVRAGAAQGTRGEPIFMDFRRTGPEGFARFRVDAPIDQPQIYEYVGPFDAAVGGEFGVNLVNGTAPFEYNPLSRDDQIERNDFSDKALQNRILRTKARRRAEGTNEQPNPDLSDLTQAPRLYLDYVEIEGPLHGPWPPLSHAILFPQGIEANQQTPEAARDFVERLLPRAYRRPVTSAEIDVITGLIAQERAQGKSFFEAMKVGLVGILCSPKFLYLLEPDPLLTLPEEMRPLTDCELASRLSYFLWSSLPDETLFELAASGRLREPGVLEAEVNRMLADPKAEALVTDFAVQWLRIPEFDRFAPDRQIFPAYYGNEVAGLGEDVKTEPLATFREILQRDESVLNFLDSDWAMLNERLAGWYGIEGVKGNEFRRVALPADSVRGGLLGMAGVHKWGSDGSRTKPVARGKYVLDVLFNDPPDPPPPNAGEVQPNPPGQHLSVSERLVQHRQNPACAHCHRRIDPYGLAFENFNVIGQWRDRLDGEQPLHYWGANRPPITLGGTLPNGRRYESFGDFKQAIQEQQDRFLAGLSEKLFTYALGRALEPADRGGIEQLVANCRAQRFTFRSLIQGLVATEAFQTK